MDLRAFANETATSESPAPGGGSISAYVGALGVSLGTMVANLSSHSRVGMPVGRSFLHMPRKVSN
jgi:glutamate formiminotransferase/formiminotetrahydrofolate cyclodeaminase